MPRGLTTPTSAANYDDWIKGAHRLLDEQDIDLEQRGANVMHPRYGAKGDGITDDTDAIQAAITDVGAGGGGTVWVPSLPFRIRRTLRSLYSGVTIRGAAMPSDGAIEGARFVTTDPLDPMLDLGDGATFINSVRVVDIGFVGGGAALRGIRARRCNYACRLERVRVTGCTHDGILLNDVSDGFVLDQPAVNSCATASTASQMWAGIAIRRGSGGNMIEKVTIRNPTLNENGTGDTKGAIYGVGLDLLDVNAVQILGGEIQGFRTAYGLRATGCQALTVQGTKFEINDRADIYLVKPAPDSGFGVLGALIAGCMMEGNDLGDYGIEVHGSLAVIVAGNSSGRHAIADVNFTDSGDSGTLNEAHQLLGNNFASATSFTGLDGVRSYFGLSGPQYLTLAMSGGERWRIRPGVEGGPATGFSLRNETTGVNRLILPSAPPAAYVQTYATVSRTHAAVTSSAVATTAATQTTPWGYGSQAQADAIPVAINAVAADLANLKQVVNSLIDDLQAMAVIQ